MIRLSSVLLRMLFLYPSFEQLDPLVGPRSTDRPWRHNGSASLTPEAQQYLVTELLYCMVVGQVEHVVHALHINVSKHVPYVPFKAGLYVHLVLRGQLSLFAINQR